MDGEPGVALALSLCLIRVTNLGIKKKKTFVYDIFSILKVYGIAGFRAGKPAT